MLTTLVQCLLFPVCMLGVVTARLCTLLLNLCLWLILCGARARRALHLVVHQGERLTVAWRTACRWIR